MRGWGFELRRPSYYLSAESQNLACNGGKGVLKIAGICCPDIQAAGLCSVVSVNAAHVGHSAENIAAVLGAAIRTKINFKAVHACAKTDGIYFYILAAGGIGNIFQHVPGSLVHIASVVCIGRASERPFVVVARQRNIADAVDHETSVW